MKKWFIHFLLIATVFKSGHVFPQDIKLPDETVTGETLRIEKSGIFTQPAPAFNVVFPELTIPDAEPTGERTAWNPEKTEEKTYGRNHFSLAVGTYDSIRAGFLYRDKNEYGTEHSVFLDNYFTSGHRENSREQKNSFSFSRMKPDAAEFSFEFDKSYIELPGKVSNPLDTERDSFSFSTGYSYQGKQVFRPSFSQSFYSIDDVEANYLLLDMQFVKAPVIPETILERLDVFKDFSTTSFYQGLILEKGNMTASGGLKLIESHGVKFLPVLRYSVNENFSIGFEGTYRIPDFYRDVMLTNYKDFTEHDLAPEEEYKLSAAFEKNTENTAFHLGLSQMYRENFYTWVDADANDLLEPYPERCWQTSAGINLKQHLFGNLSFFFEGAKEFTSKKIDFYPEEKFDTGITILSPSVFCKLWLSYTGERIFSDVETGSDAILNAELKMLFGENVELGIGVYNIADREYFTIPGYPAEGRKFVSYVKLLL